MRVSGITLTLKIGESSPAPAPRLLMDALKSVEVTHSDEGKSGFQIVFQVGRNQNQGWEDFELVKNPLLEVFNRVIILVTIGANAQVLMDGVITNQQLSPSLDPGGSTFTITGEDLSILMDLEERSINHPAQDEALIARSILANYSQYGILPEVQAPKFQDRPTTNERIPSQQGTDLQYLKQIADRFAFVFYVSPGDRSGQSIAYWGPPKRKSQIQRALSVNMGSFSNVLSVNFQTNALAPNKVEGQVQDRKTNEIKPVLEQKSDRESLVKQSLLDTLTRKKLLRIKQFRETARLDAQAATLAQSTVDRSTDNAVSVSGEIDTLRYGEVLELRGLVGLRGVGYGYDGVYYVKKVTHKLQKGEYTQNFTITREGLGANLPTLPV